jgi:hypothetical protein
MEGAEVDEELVACNRSSLRLALRIASGSSVKGISVPALARVVIKGWFKKKKV